MLLCTRVFPYADTLTHTHTRGKPLPTVNAVPTGGLWIDLVRKKHLSITSSPTHTASHPTMREEPYRFQSGSGTLWANAEFSGREAQWLPSSRLEQSLFG